MSSASAAASASRVAPGVRVGPGMSDGSDGSDGSDALSMSAGSSVPEPRVLLDSREVQETVERLGSELSDRYREGVVLVGVLRGSVLFLADLARVMTVPVSVDFVAITPYTADSGRVRLLKDLDIDVAGLHVVIVEDIVDTGLSTAFLCTALRRRAPASVAVCALLDRRARRVVPVDIAFVGAEVADDYVIGMGLDHEGRYRNLRLVAVADLDALTADPDAYVAAFYGSNAAAVR